MANLTEQATRLKFAHYFLHLKESMDREGGTVSKSAEWDPDLVEAYERGKHDAVTDCEDWERFEALCESNGPEWCPTL